MAIRAGVEEIPPALFAGSRFFLAGVILGFVARLAGQTFPPTRREWRDLAVAGIFLIALGNGLLTWSERFIGAGIASLVLGAVPLLTATIDTLVPGGRPLRPLGWAGLAVGFAGIGLLVGPDLAREAAGSANTTGLLGLLAAGTFWSAGMVYGKRRPARGGLLATVSIQMMAGGGVLLVVALATGEVGRASLTPKGVKILLYLLFVGAILGFIAYGYLLRSWPVSRVSTYGYVNPVVAVFLGWLLLDEVFTTRTAVAATVILSGVALVNFSFSRDS